MTSNARKHAKEIVRLSFLIVLSLSLGSTGHAQHYPILPVPNSPHGIFTMMQDRKSRIWMGTIDDVYSFDGEQFYSLRSAGFPHELPNSYAEDSSGALWIGTQGTDAMGGTAKGGLYRYHDGRVEKIMPGDVLGLVAAGKDMMLASFGTEGTDGAIDGDLYLIRLQNGEWSAEKLFANMADYISVDHRGNFLFVCPGGWCEIAQSAVDAWVRSRQPIVPLRHAGSAEVERVLRDRYGCVWSRAETFATYQCPNDPAPVQLSEDLSRTDSSAHLEEAADGSVFMLVPMLLGRPGHFHLANNDNGLPYGMDTAMVARDGTIWIGATNGLYRFAYPFQIELWNRSTGVGPPASLMRFAGTIFAVDRGLTSLTANRMQWQRLPSLEGLSGIGAATQNRLYVIGSSGLIGVGADRKVKSVTPVPTGKFSTHMLGDPDGTFWLGARGFFRITERNEHPVLEPQKMPWPATERSTPEPEVGDLEYDDANHTIWACLGRRIFYNRKDAWRVIARQDELPATSCSALAPLPDGSLWVGYNASQYSFIQNALSEHPVIHNFAEVTGTPIADGAVGLISADQRGRIWMRRADSLYVTTKGAAEDGTPQEDWLRLDDKDGLSSIGLFGNAFLADPDGSVWIGTETGVAHFSPPDDFATSLPAPQIFVSGLSHGGGTPELASMAHSIARTETVDVYIGSLQFDRRNGLQIRYRMPPAQPAWITTSNLHIALGRLGWGKHTLEVQARLSTGPWSSTLAQSIAIPPPFWFTWQAIFGFALAGLAFVVGGVYWRRRAQEREAKLNRALPDLAELRLSTLSPELQQLDNTVLDGRFEVGRVLARGGFAVVTEGRDRSQQGRRCAIKIFRRELGDKEWIDRRFQQEVLALEKIHHPNVVRIYGSGILPSGTMYLAMEFIEGVTLREQLETSRLPLRRIAIYLRQIGRALDAIHAVSICHRDLKPENLMLRSSAVAGQELVLIDFSIAIVKDPDKTVHGLSRAAGTISYMAPEQAIGYADAATDIYSLAKVVVEMLAGERLATLLPDASMDLPERVSELLHRLYPKLSSESVDRIAAALQFDPARRPRDAAQFAEQIASDLDLWAEA
jgi:ligand-binding sensor domain-containing protein